MQRYAFHSGHLEMNDRLVIFVWRRPLRPEKNRRPLRPSRNYKSIGGHLTALSSGQPTVKTERDFTGRMCLLLAERRIERSRHERPIPVGAEGK